MISLFVLNCLQLLTLTILSYQDFKSRHVSAWLILTLWLLCSLHIWTFVTTIFDRDILEKIAFIGVGLLFAAVILILTYIKKKSVIGIADILILIPLMFSCPIERLDLFFISSGFVALCIHMAFKRDCIPFVPCVSCGFLSSVIMSYF